MFHNNSVNIMLDIRIQKTVVCNMCNLPKTLIILIITPKKTCYIWTLMFYNCTKSAFLTISASLIGSDMLSNKGQKLFDILFCLICNISTLVFLHYFDKTFKKCKAEAKNSQCLMNNFKI